jgi:hypothetical protein
MNKKKRLLLLHDNQQDLYLKKILSPDSSFDYVPFDIFRHTITGAISIDASFSLRTYANVTVAKTYYLNTVSGNDGNAGTSPAAPKQTWNAIIGTGDYDRIIIQDGSYLIRSESSLAPTRSLEIIGEGSVYFTSSRANNLGAWSLTPAQTFTFQSTVAGGEFIARVFDEGTLDAQGNPTPYVSRSSIAEVEALAGSYWWSGGVLYVHALDGLTPQGQTNLRYYDSSAIYWPRDSLTFYFENINFRGGVSFRNATATGNTHVFLNNCTGYSLGIAGVAEFIIQNSSFFTSSGDGANYDVLNTVITRAIEIDCEFFDSGAAGNDQASTSHNGCVIARINGLYHHVTGQLAAEAGAATRTWMLGSELYNSSISNVGYYTEGIAWLDSCNIHNVTTALQIAVGATINKHNLTSNGVWINNGTLNDY